MPPQHDYEPAQEGGEGKIATELPEAGLQNSFPMCIRIQNLLSIWRVFVCSGFYFSSHRRIKFVEFKFLDKISLVE